jgi:protein TonB
MESVRSDTVTAILARMPWRSLAVSLVLHGWLLAVLMPLYPADEAGVPPLRRLKAQLHPVAVTPGVAARTSGSVTPVAVPHLRPAVVPAVVPGVARVTVVAAVPSAVSPPPTFSADVSPETGRTAAVTAVGGEPVAATAAVAAVAVARATVALAPDVVELDLPDAAGLRTYRLALAGEARRQRRVTENTRRLGLSGTAEIRILVSPQQRLAELTRSSGHAPLDTAALEMLQRAAEVAPLPESLRGRRFTLRLPVLFEADD